MLTSRSPARAINKTAPLTATFLVLIITLRKMHSHDPLSPLPRPFTVIILGSNLSSLSLALSLTRKNIAFTLLSRSPEESLIADDDTPVVLHPHGVAILTQLGVGAPLQARQTPLRGGWWGAVENSFVPLAPTHTTLTTNLAVSATPLRSSRAATSSQHFSRSSPPRPYIPTRRR